jgi:hypothetical protein
MASDDSPVQLFYTLENPGRHQVAGEYFAPSDRVVRRDRVASAKAGNPVTGKLGSAGTGCIFKHVACTIAAGSAGNTLLAPALPG